MPRPILNLASRDTKDIHAPWWSDATDESGRYLERAVIFAQFLQADQQALQSELMANMQIDAAAIARAQEGDTSAFNLDMSAALEQFEVLFERMVVELTDEEGVSQPLGRAAYAGLEPRDADFIVGEINKLNQPLVQPTRQDKEIAETQGKPVEAVMRRNFRGSRGAAAAR